MVIGLTGNIASGKSTVAHYFAKRGIMVINADVIARRLTAANSPILDRIIAHFGPEYRLSGGELDRKRLRDTIFSNPAEKKWLEQLLHPLIRKEIKAELKLSSSAYTVVEIPLLLKRSNYPYLARVISVITPRHIQIERLAARDQSSTAQAEAILASQPDLIARLRIADDLIFNDGSLKHLDDQVEKLHQHYLQLVATDGQKTKRTTHVSKRT